MPFNTKFTGYPYGLAGYAYTPSTYCQSNTSASDYGKCYNIERGKAVFVQTDTTTWPIDPTTGSDSFPCAKDGTCTRYTSTADMRTLTTIFDYPGKQAVLQYFWSRSHSNFRFYGNINYLVGVPVPYSDAHYLWLFPATNYEVSSWPVYDPVGNWKAYLNPYTIPVGYVNIFRWQGNVFTSSAPIAVYEGSANNMWYAFDMAVVYAYESSPLAVIPLNYGKEWLPYQELRSAFGYADTGVDQPGWNADDMIRVLRELFPNRAWAVFDDRQYVLYLYNLTPDYVPDWLIEKLSPTAMKVLQPPADTAVAKAWLDLLNERNAQIPPQAELP
jgi:hypothetical protein